MSTNYKLPDIMFGAASNNEVEEPTEKLSKKSLEVLRHETQIGLMVSYYTFLLNKGYKKEEAAETCRNIMSRIVEDGICTATTITEFNEAVSSDYADQFVVLTKTAEQYCPQDSLELHTLLSTSSMETEGFENMEEEEKSAVKEFAEARERYQDATDKLCGLFRGHMKNEISSLLGRYRLFDSDFVKSFSQS